MKTILSAAILCGAFLVSASAGQAYDLKQNQLPDGSKFFKARQKIQIIDNGPEVIDHRHADDQVIYSINVPPAPKSQVHVVNIPGGLPMSASAPGVLIINPNSLPTSQFSSNIPPRGFATHKNSLADGSTTNRLIGIVKPTQAPAVVSLPAPPALVASNPKVNIAVYEAAPAVGSTSTTSRSHLMGTLLKPNAK